MGWLSARQERKRLEEERRHIERREAIAAGDRDRALRYAAWRESPAGRLYGVSQMERAMIVMNELQRDPAMLFLLSPLTQVMTDTNAERSRPTWALEDDNRVKNIVAIGQMIHFEFGPLLSAEAIETWAGWHDFRNMNVSAPRGAHPSLRWRQVVAMLAAHEICHEDLEANGLANWTPESTNVLAMVEQGEIAAADRAQVAVVGEAQARRSVAHFLMTVAVGSWLQQDPRFARLHVATGDEAMRLSLFGS
jgi:hypothetical protein